jgi:hypothetical protein
VPSAAAVAHGRVRAPNVPAFRRPPPPSLRWLLLAVIGHRQNRLSLRSGSFSSPATWGRPRRVALDPPGSDLRCANQRSPSIPLPTHNVNRAGSVRARPKGPESAVVAPGDVSGHAKARPWMWPDPSMPRPPLPVRSVTTFAVGWLCLSGGPSRPFRPCLSLRNQRHSTSRVRVLGLSAKALSNASLASGRRSNHRVQNSGLLAVCVPVVPASRLLEGAEGVDRLVKSRPSCPRFRQRSASFGASSTALFAATYASSIAAC